MRCLTWVRRAPVTLVVSAAAVLAYALPELAIWLELHLSPGAALACLPLLGCHLLHWSGEHLFWDLAVFTVLGGLCEDRMPGRFRWTLLSSALGIPLVVAVADPSVHTYRGLSGIDTALFSLLVTANLAACLREAEYRPAVLFAGLWGLLACKIGWEFSSGQVLFVQLVEFQPVPIAHLGGALLGALWATIPPWSAPPKWPFLPNRQGLSL